MRALLLVVSVVIGSCSPSAAADEDRDRSAALAFDTVFVLLDSLILLDHDEPVILPVDLVVFAGRYVVVDALAQDAKLFAPDGRLGAVAGRPGSGPGEFRSPVAAASTGSALYVLDRAEMRVSVFDSAGAFQRSFPLPPGRYSDISIIDGRVVIAGRTARIVEREPEVLPPAPTLHFVSQHGEHMASAAEAAAPTKPYEGTMESFSITPSGSGSICVFVMTSNIGQCVSEDGALSSIDTVGEAVYRPVEWLGQMPPGGSAEQVTEWWREQMRFTRTVPLSDGGYLSTIADPGGTGFDYLIIADSSGQTVTIAETASDPVPPAFYTSRGDTLFALLQHPDARLTLYRYALRDSRATAPTVALPPS